MSTKKITDFTEKTSVEDSDLFLAGNQGTSSLRKLTFSNILNGIKNKFTSWTFNGLATTDKTLIGAVNEVNDNLAIKTVSNCILDSIVESSNPNVCNLYRGSFISGIFDLVEDNDVWIQVLKYPNYNTAKIIVSDVRSGRVMTITNTTKGAIFAKPHYVQTGWNTKADGTGTAYSLDTPYTYSTAGNLTLYAQYRALTKAEKDIYLYSDGSVEAVAYAKISDIYGFAGGVVCAKDFTIGAPASSPSKTMQFTAMKTKDLS